MSQRDYNAELYEKMRSEQEDYRVWLLAQSSERILDHAGEYSAKEELLIRFEGGLRLSEEKAKALLKSPCPLEDVFKTWRKQDSTEVDDYWNAVEDRAAQAVKHEREQEGR